jgi:NADH:ubiquinone oxidoreductase subunit C
MIKEQVKERLKDKIKDWDVKSPKRIYFTINNKDLKEVAKILHKEMQMRLSTVTGMDNENDFELIYHFSFDKSGELFNLRIFIEDKENPCIESLTEIFQSTYWIEREIYEMLGINFKGHPDLKRLLLDEDWPENKYPLRKNYRDE